MAKPDRIRNKRVGPEICPMPRYAPVRAVKSQENKKTTQVRIAVAMSESVLRMPHLASMEVMPAKKEEPTAYKSHIRSLFSECINVVDLKVYHKLILLCS